MNKILSFFKRVIGISGFKNTLESLNIKTAVSDKMSEAVRLWCAMYESSSRNRLSVPAAVSSEIARLVTLEMKSEITGSARADFISGHYQKVLSDLRNITEYAAAKGGVILKPYIADGKLATAYIQAENFIPTSFDSSGNINGAAFLDRRCKNDKIYTRIEHHFFENGKYIICNYAFESNAKGSIGRQISLKQTDMWQDISPRVEIEDLKKPLFAYFKMPMANTVDSSSPLGASVFSKCVDLINDAEKQYDRLIWEFKSGERALFVDTNAVKKDALGNAVLPDERLYKLLNADETLFKDWTPTIREGSIIKGLNEILRKIEFNCGLAYGTLSDVQTTDKTAEEIMASKQRSYASICDTQAALKNALTDFADSMNVLCDLYNLAPKGNYSISFEFDDSIVADRKAEFTEKLQLVSAGIMAPWEMRMWYFGEDEKTAKKASYDKNYEKSADKDEKSTDKIKKSADKDEKSTDKNSADKTEKSADIKKAQN